MPYISGFSVKWILARGRSLWPFLGMPKELAYNFSKTIRIGDYVLYESGGRYFAHRVLWKKRDDIDIRYCIIDNAGLVPVHWISHAQITGKLCLSMPFFACRFTIIATLISHYSLLFLRRFRGLFY